MRGRRDDSKAAAPSGRLLTCVLWSALVVSAATLADGQAQSPPPTDTSTAPDTATRLVAGRVVRPTAKGMEPVPQVWVVLHRVGADTAHPLDSVRSRRDGGYAFRYHHSGRADAIYFVSASHDGIAYFSPPLRGARVVGDDAELTVYDTTSRSLALQVRGRHLVIGAARGGEREVLEVYELANDSSVTLISPDGSRPTWTAPIPTQATSFQVGQSDVSADALRREGNRVLAVAPFAPGLKQVSFGYHLPASLERVRIPVDGATTVMEVLVEENAASINAPKLQRVADVYVEARRFHRFLGRDLPAGDTLTVTLPEVADPRRRTWYLAIIAIGIGAAMLAALASAGLRRRPAALPFEAAPIADDPDALAQAIVHLDADFERRAAAGSAERGTYEARRAELKDRLTRALAARRQRG